MKRQQFSADVAEDIIENKKIETKLISAIFSTIRLLFWTF